MTKRVNERVDYSQLNGGLDEDEQQSNISSQGFLDEEVLESQEIIHSVTPPKKARYTNKGKKKLSLETFQ